MLHIFAAILALSDPTAPVVEARIADVIADPERYGGQTLRIRGQVDACYGFVCSICPEEMTPGTADELKCLRMSFDGFVSEEDQAREDEGDYDPAVWREMERGFRFSVLTGEGEFDPSCMLPDVICTDRATTWRGVQVRAVHRRVPSNHGLVFDRPRGRLDAAPDEIADAVTADYRRYLTLIGSDAEDPLVVLLPEYSVVRSEAAGEEARLCVCLKDDCEGEWPRRDISTWARTPNDPYVCHVALKTDGVWRVFPE